MKICVTAVESGLDAEVDPRFGRSSYLTIVDTETMNYESFKNPNTEVAGGAGPQVAQMLGEKGVSAVITKNVGPNAETTLRALEIKVYMAPTGSVREALDRYKTGGLEEIRDQRIRF
jgi:predicted Fe-Mo cluster-binding NifX family protein